MVRRDDRQFMERALQLAAKGRGATSPNPMVGAVVVRDGRIVGEGFHRRAGTEHAEARAIREAGRQSSGASLYVNLEPCCHTGRTAPCVEKILQAGIKRVLFGSKDPDARVNGRGARLLRRAGVEVASGVLRLENEQLNETFMTFQRTGRPFVIVKAAQSLDGRVSTRSGDSRWISGPPSLKFAHQLRAEVDAVVVGAGTVREDNPALTVRRVRGKNPLRIVLSSTMNIPLDSAVLHLKDGQTILASSQAAIKAFKTSFDSGVVDFWPVKKNGRRHLDLNDFLSRAGEAGIQSILVEGGPTLATSFVRQGLADKIIIITAPLVIGKGIDGFGELGTNRLAEAVRFRRADFSNLGRDCLFVGYPERVA